MSNENNQVKKDKSAAERLSDLEQAAGYLHNTNDHITKDLVVLKNALKLLNNKVDAIVKASVSGEAITDEVLNRIMVENNVADLANKVTNMIVQGILVPEDAISANSFIVGSESDADGTVTQPRIQFALKALSADLQAKLLGVKRGASVQFEEGKSSFNVIESYKIVPPSEPEAPAAAPATPDVPAATDAPTAAPTDSETPAQDATTPAAPVAE
jgi:hypothetical protein